MTTEPDYLEVGVTATRNGITQRQHDSLWHLFDWFGDVTGNVVRLHHGDCVGGDHTAWAMADQMGWTTCSHPPDVVTKWRAWTDNHAVMPPAPYNQRNQEIVGHIVDGVLVGLPDRRERGTDGGFIRSGTWNTIRYARESRVALAVIYSDGKVDWEREWQP